MPTETQEQKQARWDADWKNAVYGASTGNPFATLCDHCHGRHKPPRDHECPYCDKCGAKIGTDADACSQCG